MRLGEGRHDILDRNPLADNHHIHVAAACLGAGRHGTANESELNLGTQPGETALQNPGNAERLADNPMHLLEYRTRSICLEIGLPAFHGARQNARADELLQFPLHGAGPQRYGTNDLPLVETPVRVAKQKPQHRLARGAKQRRSDGVARHAVVVTHLEYDSTLNGFMCQE